MDRSILYGAIHNATLGPQERSNFFWIGLKRRSTEPVSHVTKMDECLLLSDEM